MNMRKFISRETLNTAQRTIQNAITVVEKGPELLALYLAERELTDAIAAASMTPAEPEVPKKRAYNRKNKGDNVEPKVQP
jgi:hypothetical protein